jgi:hypothetical protein
MKGLIHFVTGIAVATCFPEIVGHAEAGALWPLLGGIAGVLPDTLDFKVLRYFERFDLELDPGPQPDVCRIAGQLVSAMREAYETGTRRRVLLRTVRLGPDAWQQYGVAFDPDGMLTVRVGPRVDTAQQPLPGQAAHPHESVGVPVDISLRPDFRGEVQADIFSGPSLTFEREGDALAVRLLPWHRRWTHSPVFAVVLGLGTAAVAAASERLRAGSLSSMPLWAGLSVALAVLAHVGMDQLGHMGSCLLWPLRRRRVPGLGLFHSGDAAPNFAAFWAMAWLTLANLARFAGTPVRAWPMVLLGLLPVIVLGGAAAWRRRQRPSFQEGRSMDPDVLAEIDDTGGG